MKHQLIVIAMVMAVIALSKQTPAQDAHSKSNLKILFVGYDPSKLLPGPKDNGSYPGEMTKEAFIADYHVRMPAFKKLLSEYFTDVQTIDCRDWKPADSGPYDVTIFDFEPRPMKEENKSDQDSFGWPRYLPDNFSKPVVFIASTAPQIGERIGLKLDWLCLCLNADAHHLNTQHPIFKGPLNIVTPTLVMKETPKHIYEYSSGDTVPKQIPMWRVQTADYYTDKDCRIGLVSRGDRFTEGPDAEVISSGVCLKDVTAVALGRQGNFFLWGFGASPAQMTEEAKKVFVNVVAYMKQFDGKSPVAKKYNQGMATTGNVKDMVASVNEKTYKEYVQQLTSFNKARAARKKELDEKKAKGIKLTPEEEEESSYSGTPQPILSWEDYLKEIMGSYWKKFGTDAAGFQKYMTDNFDYIYCNPKAQYSYEIDTAVQQIGVPNHSINLLDSCVSMLEHNDRFDLALSILKKYTTQNFNSAAEWRSWLTANRNKLFFCETDGYKFIINTYN